MEEEFCEACDCFLDEDFGSLYFRCYNDQQDAEEQDREAKLKEWREDGSDG